MAKVVDKIVQERTEAMSRGVRYGGLPGVSAGIGAGCFQNIHQEIHVGSPAAKPSIPGGEGGIVEVCQKRLEALLADRKGILELLSITDTEIETVRKMLAASGADFGADPPDKEVKPTETERQIFPIARVVHEVTRIFRIAEGEYSSPPWKDVAHPPWEEAMHYQKHAAFSETRVALDGGSPEQVHEAWMHEMRASGWSHGPELVTIKKQHPGMVPYDQLSAMQRNRIDVIIAVARAMAFALSCKLPVTP